MDRPSVRQLECVVAVAEYGSFRKAAASLGISQPALSAQIQSAEHLFGLQIFERDRRSVLITSAGDEVVGRAREALTTIDAVADAARRRGLPLVGPLRLGVIPTVAPYWLPALLPLVRASYKQLELVLREDQTHRLLTQLGAGQIDAALLALPVPGDFTGAEVARERFVLAVPKSSPLAGKSKVTEKDLDEETVLLLEDGHCLRDQALAVCDRGGAIESMEVRGTSLPTLVQMVAGNLGVTLLPEAAADALVSPRTGVKLIDFSGTPPGRTLGLVWRTSSGRLREFKLLAQTLKTASDTFVAKLRA